MYRYLDVLNLHLGLRADREDLMKVELWAFCCSGVLKHFDLLPQDLPLSNISPRFIRAFRSYSPSVKRE